MLKAIMTGGKKQQKYIVFNSMGIPEKEIAGTAVVSSIKDAYPDENILVVSANPEVWLHNPDVFRVYRGGATPYFFEDFIKDKDTRIFWQDPFSTDSYIRNKKNLIQAWCELCKIPWNKKDPQMYFTFREYEATERMMQQNLPLNLRQSLCASYLRDPIRNIKINSTGKNENK